MKIALRALALLNLVVLGHLVLCPDAEAKMARRRPRAALRGVSQPPTPVPQTYTSPAARPYWPSPDVTIGSQRILQMYQDQQALRELEEQVRQNQQRFRQMHEQSQQALRQLDEQVRQNQQKFRQMHEQSQQALRQLDEQVRQNQQKFRQMHEWSRQGLHAFDGHNLSSPTYRSPLSPPSRMNWGTPFSHPHRTPSFNTPSFRPSISSPSFSRPF